VSDAAKLKVSSFHRAEARLRSFLSPWLLRLWYDCSLVQSRSALYPLLSFSSELYRFLQKRNARRAGLHRNHLPAYVISIGNLVAGGTGKTPFVIWLAEYLQSHGLRFAILSRGYGGQNRTVSRAPEQGDMLSQSFQFGDEPVLLARRLNEAPVWIGRERWLSGQKAIQSDKADVLILDDGFQHFSLFRDLDLVLLDSSNPFGNGFLLPVGPLREPIHSLQRAAAFILTRADDNKKSNETRLTLRRLFPDRSVFCCRHVLSGFRFGIDGEEVPLATLYGLKAIAFAGIARPESFFSSITAAGIRVAEQFAFPDHHFYAPQEVSLLLESLKRNKADLLITTEKDVVRFPAEFHSTVLTARLDLDFGIDRQKLYDFLGEQIGAIGS